MIQELAANNLSGQLLSQNCYVYQTFQEMLVESGHLFNMFRSQWLVTGIDEIFKLQGTRH